MIIPDGELARAEAATTIRRGGVIGYRTDTLYALGANPSSSEAVSKIIKLKGREDGKPILLLISDLEIVPHYLSRTSDLFHAIANRFWPGPLTLIGEARNQLPQDLTGGTNTLGLRLPNSSKVRELVRACGGALTATSANPSGEPPALTALELENYFPEIDLVIEGGAVIATEPSTVLNVSGSEVQLLREGAIKCSELEEWLS